MKEKGIHKTQQRHKIPYQKLQFCAVSWYLQISISDIICLTSWSSNMYIRISRRHCAMLRIFLPILYPRFSSVIRVNCYQQGSCVEGPSAFISPFGHWSRSHNIRPLNNHLPGLSISLSSLTLS